MGLMDLQLRLTQNRLLAAYQMGHSLQRPYERLPVVDAYDSRGS